MDLDAIVGTFVEFNVTLCQIGFLAPREFGDLITIAKTCNAFANCS